MKNPVVVRKNKQGAGRPFAKIDWDDVKKLCQLQCTQKEIISFLNICKDTLYDRCRNEQGVDFSTFYDQNSAGGKCCLRRMQWQSAESGNSSLLIFLGKNYLNQTDKIEQSIDHTTTALTPDERARMKHEQRLAALGPVDTDEIEDDVA